MRYRCTTRFRELRAGFALLELLVVIAIIALLLSILLPVLARTREAANSLKCEVNLRSIGQAMMLHANEHHQYFPLVGAQYAGPTGTSQDTPENLADAAMQKYDYLADWGGLRPTALPAALAPYLGMPCRSDYYFTVEADIAVGPLQAMFSCPSDQNIAECAPSSFGSIIEDGAAFNTHLTGYSSYCDNNDALGFGPNNTRYDIRHARAAGFIPAIGNPSRTMLLCDGQGDGSIGAWQRFDMFCTSAPDTMADVYHGSDAGGFNTSGPINFDLIRHRGRMNVLFADGHVDNVAILKSGGTIALPGDGPSGDLASIWMDKDFPQ